MYFEWHVLWLALKVPFQYLHNHMHNKNNIIMQMLVGKNRRYTIFNNNISALISGVARLQMLVGKNTCYTIFNNNISTLISGVAFNVIIIQMLVWLSL